MKLDLTKIFDKNDKIDGRRNYYVHVYKDDELIYRLRGKVSKLKKIELKGFDDAFLVSENTYFGY